MIARGKISNRRFYIIAIADRFLVPRSSVTLFLSLSLLRVSSFITPSFSPSFAFPFSIFPRPSLSFLYFPSARRFLPSFIFISIFIISPFCIFYYLSLVLAFGSLFTFLLLLVSTLGFSLFSFSYLSLLRSHDRFSSCSRRRACS